MVREAGLEQMNAIFTLYRPVLSGAEKYCNIKVFRKSKCYPVPSKFNKC